MNGISKQISENVALSEALHPSTSREYVFPTCDRVLFGGENGGDVVLKNFLQVERRHLAAGTYFESVQTEITSPMRAVLTQWMMEVCEDEGCTCEIFPLAVAFVDRFLSVEAVHKHQLQVLGTACLFLSSKVKLTQPMSAARLIQYTDDSVSLSTLLSWELLVLNRLNWDLATLTAFDFVDQYTQRLRLSADFLRRLRPSLNYLISISATDFNIALLPPSILAAGCVLVATVNVLGETEIGCQLAAALRRLINFNLDVMEIITDAIYDLYLRRQKVETKQPLQQIQASPGPFSYAVSSAYRVKNEQQTPPPSTGFYPSTASTPTDIDDVAIF